MNQKKRGFTLIEVLVVVLIIGVLTAVALPQYQKAVLKSRYSALMPIAKSIANGNEAYYLEHGVYATSPASLDVAGQDEYPDGTQIDIQPDESENASEEYNFVIASRDHNFPLNYLVYQNHSPKFAGNIHCEAEENNTMAQEICQSLGGQYIGGSQTDGFMTYVLSGTQGANDKLPSSLTKLAQTVCGEDTNCTAQVKGNTVVSESCTGNMTATAGQTCITRTYDDTSAQVDYKRTEKTCTNTTMDSRPVKRCVTESFNDQNTKIGDGDEYCYTSIATWADGVCTPKTSANSSYYTGFTTEGDKRVSESRFCLQIKDGVCSVNQESRNEQVNGLSAGYKVAKCNGSVNADITCNNGEWVSSGRSDFNEQGKWTAQFYCNAYSAANVCTTVNTGGSRWATYAADNTTQTSETTVTQSGNNVTFTTKSKPANTVTNTATCAITNADWDTGTCKPGTAI